MAVPHDAADVRVRIATAEAGPYNTLGYVRSGDLQRGSEGARTFRWLGGKAIRAGSRTIGGSIPIWWDNEDPSGQDLAESAWEDGTPVYLQFCLAGTAAGAEVIQFRALIDSAPLSFDGESEDGSVEGSFDFTGEFSTYQKVELE